MEIDQKSHKEWFSTIWEANGWKPGDPVTRTEFQLRRDFLRSMQVNSVADLIAQMSDVWSYLVKKWLSIRHVSKDTNRSRWKVKPYWKAVQRAVSAFGEITGVSRIKQYRPKYSALKQLAEGTMVSIAALVGTVMGGDPVALGRQYIRKDFLTFLDSLEFEHSVRRRGAKFATMKL